MTKGYCQFCIASLKDSIGTISLFGRYLPFVHNDHDLAEAQKRIEEATEATDQLIIEQKIEAVQMTCCGTSSTFSLPL
jgi:hypothetical protein